MTRLVSSNLKVGTGRRFASALTANTSRQSQNPGDCRRTSQGHIIKQTSGATPHATHHHTTSRRKAASRPACRTNNVSRPSRCCRILQCRAHTSTAGTVDATEATSISLVQHDSKGLAKIETFQPRFTYPIFEEERIFGHRGLKINIYFHASDMRPHFSTSSTKKYADVSGTEPEDIRKTMDEFLPKGMVTTFLPCPSSARY